MRYELDAQIVRKLFEQAIMEDKTSKLNLFISSINIYEWHFENGQIISMDKDDADYALELQKQFGKRVKICFEHPDDYLARLLQLKAFW